MDVIAYHRSCPHCGCDLKPNALGPDTPPWRCDECHTSWWVAELSQYARQHYNPHKLDWGHRGSEPHLKIRAQVAAELEVAIKRGVSLRREQLGLVLPRTLDALMRRGLHISKDFLQEMQAQVTT